MFRSIFFYFLAFVLEGTFVPAGQAAPADSIFVLFTANTNGQLLDCGCETGVAGGLPRRKTVLDSIRAVHPEVLVIDGGDLFATNDRQWQNWMMLDSYRKLGYDVMAPGDQEFWNGLHFFQKKAPESRVPFVCSNGTGIFSDCAIQFRKRIAGFSVQVVALLDSSAFGFFPEERMPKIKLENPQGILSRLLAGKSDLRIVIFHGEQFRLKPLLAEFPEVDVWLLAHHQKKMPENWTELPHPAVVTCGEDGEGVVLVKIARRNRRASWIVFARRILLQESIRPNPEMTDRIRTYYDHLKQNLAGARSKPYRSVQACRHCHLLAYESWRKSPHFSEESSRKNVFCKDCHQVAERHGEWEFLDKAAVAGARNCKTCHKQKDISFARDWEAIKHE